MIHTDNRVYPYPIILFVIMMSATNSAAEKTDLSQSRASGRSQPKPEALSDRGARARTWYFTFDMHASDAGVASQLKAFEFSPFRKSNWTAASVISFSFTDGSPEIRGFTTGGNLLQKSVQTWLTHSGSAISDLQLHPISDRFNDPRIRSFLEQSDLPDAGGSAMPGRRLRLDTMAECGDPRAARGGGHPRLRPMVESAAPQQQLLAAAADARPAQQRPPQLARLHRAGFQHRHRRLSRCLRVRLLGEFV